MRSCPCGPLAAPVRVLALREGIGGFGGFGEPRPVGMSARSIPPPASRRLPARRPRRAPLPGLAVQFSSGSDFVVETRPRVAWTLLKRSLPLPGVSRAVPRSTEQTLARLLPALQPAPAPSAQALPCLAVCISGFPWLASGYAFFPGRSPEHSSSSQRARLGLLPLFPESSRGVGIRALSSARLRAWVSPRACC